MAWTMGTIVSVIGLYLSWRMDLPSGPAVIIVLGFVLFGDNLLVLFLYFFVKSYREDHKIL